LIKIRAEIISKIQAIQGPSWALWPKGPLAGKGPEKLREKAERA
jgi:hypothetical protein